MTMAISMLKKEHSWQEALSNLITDPKDLWALLELDPALLEAAYQAAQLFPLKITHSFASRMEKGNINDPLLKQVVPLGAELLETQGYELDPLKEQAANPIPGLLHKYKNRALITLTSACAVHCRYCFRRHFAYADNNPGRSGWEKIIAYINEHQTIDEVILSGGDPLSVSDKLLKQFTDKLSDVAHIKRIRLHTRLPIVLPERVTDGLLQWIVELPWPLTIVVHANHPQEINEEVTAALIKLKNAGAMLLNQSVLLKDINDSVLVLKTLSERLFAANVLPYYLHVCDKVQNTAHYDVPHEVAKRLYAELAGEVSGYLLPKLAIEEPGKYSKTLLSTAI